MSSDRPEKVSLEDVVKVALLGEGSQGTVWSARSKTSSRGRRRKISSAAGIEAAPYALKQRLIKSSDAAMRDARSSSAFREIEFYTKVANKHPSLFSRLYDWSVTIATPEFKAAFSSSASGSGTSKKYTHILTTLSARKEGVLKAVYRTLSYPQWLSMLAQVCYAIALLHDRGFSHHDIWEANIAFVRLPWRSDVSIFRNTVPSLGFGWSIIDYGDVEYRGQRGAVRSRDKRHTSNELDDIVSLVSGEEDAREQCGQISHKALESEEFQRQVLSSVDGPSVKLLVKQTGLPIHSCLALLSLDSYVWHVCGQMRHDSVKAWLDRGALLQIADAKASYSSLASNFAKMARDAVKDTR